jgi:hypothetical protein
MLFIGRKLNNERKIMSVFYYAHITHDNLKGRDVPKGKQRVLVYVAEGKNSMDAERQFRGLESQFQGLNFKILYWAPLLPTPNTPVFMGSELQRKAPAD